MREAACLMSQITRQRYRAPRRTSPPLKFVVWIRGRERGSRLREAKQPLTCCVIRVFNDAGKVIETHNTLAISNDHVCGDEAGVLSEASETYAAESR